MSKIFLKGRGDEKTKRRSPSRQRWHCLVKDNYLKGNKVYVFVEIARNYVHNKIRRARRNTASPKTGQIECTSCIILYEYKEPLRFGARDITTRERTNSHNCIAIIRLQEDEKGRARKKTVTFNLFAICHFYFLVILFFSIARRNHTKAF